MAGEPGARAASNSKGGRKRKHPKNTEWRGAVLWGRIRIKGTLRRWTLRTGDVDVAAARVTEDIRRLKDSAFYSENRTLYNDMVAAWGERHILHEVGAKTAKRYAVSLKQLEPYLMDLYLDQVNTRAKIDEIIVGRRAKGVSTATIRRDLSALSSVIKFADLDDNAALARLKKLKERRDPIVLPDPAHIERIIVRLNTQMATMAAVAWKTGCRLDELQTAERSRLDHNRRQLTVIGKGNKLRVIELDFGGAYELLRSLPVRLGCRWLFWHGNGLPYRNVGSRFYKVVRAEMRAAERAAEEAGHEEPDFRVFRFHDLRHRHAVDWLRAGRSIYDLQQRLGHTSIGTTEMYLRFLTPEEKRSVMFGVPQESQKESPA